MIKMIKLIGTVFTLTLALSSHADKEKDDPNLDLIEARQGEMTLRSFYLGPLVGMAKGELPYDAELATKLASDLKLLGSLDMGRAWAPDTDKTKYPDETTALGKIWSTYPEIAEYGEKYDTAVDALANSAGKGLNKLRANIGDVGDSCKGCHDEFREKH